MDIMFGGTESKKSVNMYVEAVRNNLEKAYKDVREQMKVVQKRQREFYNERKSGKPYEKEDRVGLYTPYTRTTKSKKLYQAWFGPYRVVKRLSDSVYRVRLVGGRKRRVVNFNRLKPYATN
ncbi:Hypothetical predicted protein [Paramuricea clavata]|uniref:Integrase p58-like C-terminal domain-containing protein n=1 Tax=Paramuricea clavata TaxID=317549 RepID=A0A6S7IMI9_PARCT|nr:Hypothetical predicted protein [Paramuricea clavata]